MLPLNIYIVKRNHTTFLPVMEELKSGLSQNGLTGDLSYYYSFLSD